MPWNPRLGRCAGCCRLKIVVGDGFLQGGPGLHDQPRSYTLHCPCHPSDCTIHAISVPANPLS